MSSPAPRSRPALPEPEGSDPKEVFAHFGVTVYHCQCLETAAMNVSYLLTLGNGTTFTTEMVNRVFDDIRAQTLGRLLASVRKVITVPDALDEVLKVALQARNFVVHRFFYEHAEDFLTERGRVAMLSDLRDIGEKVVAADRALEPVAVSLAERYGVTPERVEQDLHETLVRLGVIEESEPEAN